MVWLYRVWYRVVPVRYFIWRKHAARCYEPAATFTFVHILAKILAVVVWNKEDNGLPRNGWLCTSTYPLHGDSIR